jgi:hypothetical protein
MLVARAGRTTVQPSLGSRVAMPASFAMAPLDASGAVSLAGLPLGPFIQGGCNYRSLGDRRAAGADSSGA